jgi:hypothetical protein
MDGDLLVFQDLAIVPASIECDNVRFIFIARQSTGQQRQLPFSTGLIQRRNNVGNANQEKT